MIKTIDVKNGETKQLYKYLSSAITPRPIALVSTMDNNGIKNLAPFSFFNVFSIEPPILVFSPVKRVRDNSSKHTIKNIYQNKECVISIVTEEIAQQVSLTSCDYPEEINEFKKAGFTEIKSEEVTPPRIKESPINFECKVNDIIELGNKGGAGSLVISEILKIHINQSVLDQNNDIDPFALNIVSRYGGNWYGKSIKDSLYEIVKPHSSKGIGIDQLPLEIKDSTILTGNELAILASVEKIPMKQKVNLKFSKDERHSKAKSLLLEGKIKEAWQILL
tara:strand:- start:2835 stop:3668 length:834 start_codon:yes stop_codon:yes gene_type:complete